MFGVCGSKRGAIDYLIKGQGSERSESRFS